MKTKINNYKFKQEKRPFGLLKTIYENQINSHEKGYVRTLHGFVEVYSQGDDKFNHYTSVSMILDGFWFHRNINKRYSQKFLVTFANRFANDCFAKQNPSKSGMGFSMDGLRSNMSNDIRTLKQMVESIALTDFGIINHSGVDCEDLKHAMNQVIQNSNILNCTFDDEIEDDWNLMLDSCVDKIGDEN